jgi:hypothetical protein
MANVTLGELKKRGQLRADMAGSGFVSDAELTEYANAALSELYDILVQSYEDYIDPTIHSITLVSGTESYDLPSDLYKIRKVRGQQGSTNLWLKRVPLDQVGNDNFMWQGHALELAYYPLGTKIYFTPSPTSGTVEVWYIPAYKYATNDAHDIHYAIPVGWTEYVTLGIAIRCRNKEQTDASPLVMEREQQRKRIIEASKNRDQGEPDQVIDVDGRFRRRSGWGTW